MPDAPTNLTDDQNDTALPEWRGHLAWLMPASLVVLLVASLWMWRDTRRTRVRMDLMEAFSMAREPADYESIALSWPGHPEAAIALLRAGELRYKAGEYSDALARYEEFLSKHAAHPLAEAGTWGRLLCLEAAGKTEEALQGYLGITKESPLYPQALFGRARVHEKGGELEAAQVVYDLVQAEFPDTPWANQAAEFRKVVDLALRSAAK